MEKLTSEELDTLWQHYRLYCKTYLKTAESHTDKVGEFLGWLEYTLEGNYN